MSLLEFGENIFLKDVPIRGIGREGQQARTRVGVKNPKKCGRY